MMLVTKIINKVCKEKGAKRIDATSLRIGTKTIRVYDNDGIYDVVSLNHNFGKPRTARNVFATDLHDVISNFIKGV